MLCVGHSWCVMVAVQSLGVPSQLTTEYRARAGGMRVRTTVGSSREASTQGPKFAKKLDSDDLNPTLRTGLDQICFDLIFY